MCRNLEMCACVHSSLLITLQNVRQECKEANRYIRTYVWVWMKLCTPDCVLGFVSPLFLSSCVCMCVCFCVCACLTLDVPSTSSASQSTCWCPHPRSSHIPAPRHLVLPSERWLTRRAGKGKKKKNSLKSNIKMTDNWSSRQTKALVYVKGHRPRSSAAKFFLMLLQLLED